ncbi:MAG TPA: galactofuranose ABC transporter, permease protein YjfF [Opitutaceae bacterium]|nr:galactofuranose ABC transporter, permease protein YjfF [Opitutaceae bacterium]
MIARWQRHLTLVATAFVLAVLYTTAALLYPGFFSAGVLANLLTDNAALGIAAVGLTLVIFSGGIDLSVGAVVGFTSIFTATLVQQHGFHPATAAVLALLIGAALGATMGAIIHFFRQPPFLITLAGMFFMRGCAFWITTEQLPFDHPFFLKASAFAVPLGKTFSLPATALALLAVLVIGSVLAHLTRFGRNLLALGGSEQSALLMGLPIGPTKIGAYAVNGVCAAIAGVVATLYTGAGNASLGLGLELDAIAVVVIGGTLLTGGRGHMFGTLLGVLIFGTIQSALLFDGRLNSAWVRIVVGALLLAFILLQRFLVRGLRRR